MTRLTARLLSFVLLALAGAALLALTPAFAYADDTALIMGGTGYGHPPPDYVTDAYDLYIQPKYPEYTPEGLDTLEQYWPITGLNSLTFDESVMHDAGVLDTAIREQNAAGNDVVASGYSSERHGSHPGDATPRGLARRAATDAGLTGLRATR